MPNKKTKQIKNLCKLLSSFALENKIDMHVLLNQKNDCFSCDSMLWKLEKPYATM